MTFTDHNGAHVAGVGGLANLSTLADGLITVSISATDTAGNTASGAGTSTTLDTTADVGGNLAVSVSDSLISNSEKTAVAYTVSGLDADATATVTFTDHNGAHVAGVGGLANLSTLADGLITVSISATDTAGNTASGAGTSTTLDTTADVGGNLAVSVSDSLISNSEKTAVAYTVSGLDADATATVTFTDHNGAHVAGVGGLANLSTLADGLITVSISATDTAGNTASGAGTSTTLDTTADVGGNLAVSVSDSLISNSEKTAVAYTVSGLDADATATVTFTDHNGAHVAGVGGLANLSTLADGLITVSISATDTAGNTASGAGTSTTLDTTADVGGNLAVSVSDSLISNSEKTAVAYTVSGLDADATATVTFTDHNGAHVAGVGGLANLSTLADGLITVSISATDTAGNTASGAGTSTTLDTTAPAAPTVALASDTGSSSSDHITSNGLLAVTPAEAGGTIQYSTNGGVSWTGSFTAVEGANNVEVRQVDAAGNNGAAALFSFTLDTTAPAEALAITAIATDTGTVGDFITSDTTLIVSGTNGALAAGDKIQVSSDGGVTWHDVVQNTATSWSYDDTATTHATSFTYQARVIDIASNVGATASQPVTIDTTAPVNTVPAGPLTVNEDTALTFTNGSAISVHDVNGNLASTQLSVQHGKLTVSLAGGAQISAGTNGSGALTLSGAEAQINAVLATLTYQGGSNFNGSDTLTVTSTDSAAGIDIDSVSINVTALNDPPVNTVPGTQTVSSGTPRYFNTANGNAISISDVDVNETAAPNNIAQVNLTVAQGTLTLTALDGISITGGANNSSNITLQGTLAAINNALASLSFEGTASTTLTVTTNDLGHTGAGSAVPVQSNIQINVTPADPHLWGTFTYPPQPTAGVHIFNPGLAPNPANGFVALGFSSTPNYDPIQNPGGPYPLTINVTAFDPFFLPELNVLPVETVNTTLPARQSFDAPNIANGSSINGEGLAFFVTNTNGHNVINKSIIGGSNSGNSISATPPIVLKDVGTDTIFNLRSSVRQDSSISGTPVLTTYQVSWDQFNASAHTYSVNFKLFNANNTQVAEVDNALSLPNVQTITTAPAWAFGGGGGAYVLAYGSTVSNHDVLNFQGYTTAGAPTQIISAGATSFQIAPDLSHYATGAVNHITQIQVPTLGAAPGGPSNALAFGGFSQATGFSYATAWSETVVEFHRYARSGRVCDLRSGCHQWPHRSHCLAEHVPDRRWKSAECSAGILWGPCSIGLWRQHQHPTRRI